MIIRLIIGLAITVFSLVYLVAVAIPNIQRANEEVRIAQIEADQANAELDQAMDDVSSSIDELNERNDIQ